MQTIMTGTRGLSLLLQMQWDRVLFLGVVGGGLTAGAWLCSLYLA